MPKLLIVLSSHAISVSAEDQISWKFYRYNSKENVKKKKKKMVHGLWEVISEITLLYIFSTRLCFFYCLCKPQSILLSEINECQSDPCLNGATCTDQLGAWLCLCVSGFTGTMCENDINECSSDPCQNNGTCVNNVDNYVCECPGGYQGYNCETGKEGVNLTSPNFSPQT